MTRAFPRNRGVVPCGKRKEPQTPNQPLPTCAGGEAVDLDGEALAAVDVRKTTGQVTLLEDALEQAAPDLTAVARYAERAAEYDRRLADLEAATASRDQVLSTPSLEIFS